jgi:CTP synthase
VVGKYIELHDAYKSIYESLDHAGIANDVEVEVRKVKAEDVLDRGTGILLGVDGCSSPAASASAGMEGKIEAVRWAREQGVPFFGICLGLQCAVVELRAQRGGPGGRPFDRALPPHRAPVIHLMPSQERVHEKGGTMRLGAYACSVARARAPASSTARTRSQSATATATSSTTPTATAWSPAAW